jgi:hypothetical protein
MLRGKVCGGFVVALPDAQYKNAQDAVCAPALQIVDGFPFAQIVVAAQQVDWFPGSVPIVGPATVQTNAVAKLGVARDEVGRAVAGDGDFGAADRDAQGAAAASENAVLRWLTVCRDQRVPSCHRCMYCGTPLVSLW